MCYDHLAGRLGVAVCDMLLRGRYVVLSDGLGEVTVPGERFLGQIGVDLERARGAKRRYCRSCIDWTERRHHVSGAVGAAIAEAFLRQHWIARIPDSRAVTVTSGGREALGELGARDFLPPTAPRPLAHAARLTTAS